MTHIYHPGLGDPNRPAILVDGCPNCESSARNIDQLDGAFTAALWRKMVAVEHVGGDHYASHAEAEACRALHRMALLMERYLTDDPWTVFAVPA